MWLRRITPVVLAANVALLFAAAFTGHWLAAIYSGMAVGAGCITLLTHRSKARRSLSAWQRRGALGCLAVSVPLLFAALLAGLWGQAAIMAVVVVLAWVTLVVDEGDDPDAP